ncbi:MAG: copper resistance protein B [Caulobacteraceae bacterium]
MRGRSGAARCRSPAALAGPEPSPPFLWGRGWGEGVAALSGSLRIGPLRRKTPHPTLSPQAGRGLDWRDSSSVSCPWKTAALIAASIALLLPPAAHAQIAAPFGPPVDDRRVYVHGLFDQLEGRLGSGNDNSFRWEGEAWVGTDANRLWIKSEGEVDSQGRVSDGQQEIFYDRPVSTYFDLQGGVRYDADSGPGRGWAAFGIEGLAPWFFKVSATGYVGDAGRFAAKAMVSYDQLLTNRLIVGPEAEVNFYAKDDPARRIGSGLSDLDAGLRLRYEITRKFAPYIGVTFERKFGATADFVRAAGERSADVRFTTGLRTWF